MTTKQFIVRSICQPILISIAQYTNKSYYIAADLNAESCQSVSWIILGIVLKEVHNSEITRLIKFCILTGSYIDR